MTLSELLTALARDVDPAFLAPDAKGTLEAAEAEQTQNPVVGEIIRAWIERVGHRDPEARIERVDAVNALARTRLKYMADDAPIDAFRLVEKTITQIDAAFNDEALASKSK
ncbi:MAG: hypothetical protein ACK4IT_09230 [Thioalkalivibrionaceae bacterium]